jgi:hypothetical protein
MFPYEQRRTVTASRPAQKPACFTDGRVARGLGQPPRGALDASGDGSRRCDVARRLVWATFTTIGVIMVMVAEVCRRSYVHVSSVD